MQNARVLSTAVALCVSMGWCTRAYAQGYEDPDQTPKPFAGPPTLELPLVVQLGVGPALGLLNQDSFIHFKLTQDLIYHVNGTTYGPNLGLSAGESFGQDAFVFQGGLRVGWDAVSENLVGGNDVVLAPYATFGAVYAEETQRDRLWAFSFQLGGEGRFVLSEQWLFLVRPLSVDFSFFRELMVRYNIMLGLSFRM